MSSDKKSVIILVLVVGFSIALHLIPLLPIAWNDEATSTTRTECPMCLSVIPKDDYDEYSFAEHVYEWPFYGAWLPENRDSYIVERSTLHDLYVAAYVAGYSQGLTGEEDAQATYAFAHVGDSETALDWLEKLLPQYGLK